MRIEEYYLGDIMKKLEELANNPRIRIATVYITNNSLTNSFTAVIKYFGGIAVIKNFGGIESDV